MFTNGKFRPVLSETDSKAIKGQTEGRQCPPPHLVGKPHGLPVGTQPPHCMLRAGDHNTLERPVLHIYGLLSAGRSGLGPPTGKEAPKKEALRLFKGRLNLVLPHPLWRIFG